MAETKESGMAAMDILRHAVDGATVRTVFGEPITQGGVTVVPVARVRMSGGGGGGTGPAPDGGDATGSGSGSGFLRSCRPVGVYILSEGRVSWRPAVEVNKIIIGGQLVAIVALLTIRAFIRSRGR